MLTPPEESMGNLDVDRKPIPQFMGTASPTTQHTSLQGSLPPTSRPQPIINSVNGADVRPRRHSLQLLIPQDGQSYGPSPDLTPYPSPFDTPSTAQSTSPDTPASATSPTAGVIDLTLHIKTANESPVTTGGFSDIYRGKWTRQCPNENPQFSSVMVAIKLLRVLAVTDDERARRRLNREVYIWHRLEHPNIVKLFGTSYHMSGRPSMVMQWYENGSADRYLRDPSNVSVDRNKLVRDVAEGLNYLHTLPSPIVHGDLKSNNVLITDDGHGVLSDFGLSQIIVSLQCGPPGLTPSTSGPIRWQAPELLEDDTCQPSLETDVWSFGCTVYEILTGNIPYHYRQRDALVIRDVQSGIKPPGPEGLSLAHENTIVENIMDRCWSFTSLKRPRMFDIVLQMEKICI